jgi:hypothetical protein
MRHVSFSNVVALLALFVALGGTAWALANNSVKSRHIDNGQVKTEDLDGDAVTGGKIEAAAVKASDVGDEELTGTDVEDGALSGNDIADGTVNSADIADGTVSGTDVNEASLTAGGALTGSLANAALDDSVVDAEALAELPSVRMELPRDASNCSSLVDVPASSVVEVPWLSTDEGGGLAPLPQCATDVIVPVGGFYLITLSIGWGSTGGASEVTAEITRAGGAVASETIPVPGGDTDQVVAMATSVAAGAPLAAQVSHDGNADATLFSGEMVVHFLGPKL